MLNLEIGKSYAVKHQGSIKIMRFDGHLRRDGHSSKFGTWRTNATHHYVFTNLLTGRQVEIKSLGKIHCEA